MKYLVVIGVIAVAGVAGYFIGVNLTENKFDLELADNEPVTEYVYDTIVKNKRVEVPVYIEANDTIQDQQDSLEIEVVDDTLMQSINSKDTSNSGEEISIRRDELIGSKRIPIIYLEEPIKKDSIMKELLGIKESHPTDMIVQFWRSPLNFTGYKLSKNTLILYGLPEQFNYKIYYKNHLHYLSSEGFFYVIKETQEFLSYREVDKNTVLND